MSTPPEKLADSIGHLCQTGCGALADVALVQLATAETDIMCQPCLVAMMTAVIGQVADAMSAEDPIGTLDAADLAAKVATQALAAG